MYYVNIVPRASAPIPTSSMATHAPPTHAVVPDVRDGKRKRNALPSSFPSPHTLLQSAGVASKPSLPRIDDGPHGGNLQQMIVLRERQDRQRTSGHSSVTSLRADEPSSVPCSSAPTASLWSQAPHGVDSSASLAPQSVSLAHLSARLPTQQRMHHSNQPFASCFLDHDRHNLSCSARSSYSSSTVSAANLAPCSESAGVITDQMRHRETSRTQGLWNASAHLQFITKQLYYTRLYRFHYWSVAPLNPACLKATALSYILTTEEGLRERSPLSVSVYYALHIGDTRSLSQSCLCLCLSHSLS
jgi:hypothetical protein